MSELDQSSVSFTAQVRVMVPCGAARIALSFRSLTLSNRGVLIDQDMDLSSLPIGRDQWATLFTEGKEFHLQVEPHSEDLPLLLARGILHSKLWQGSRLLLQFDWSDVSQNDLYACLN